MTMKNRRRPKSLLKYLVLTCFLVLTISPFVWMLLISLKRSQGEIYVFPVRYTPNPIPAVNYVAVLRKGNFSRYVLNSFFSPAAVATCAVFIAILTSYVIDRFHFRSKSVLLLSFLVAQMIPTFIMSAPLYQLLVKAKVLNNLRSLTMLYTDIVIPFSVVTLCGFFDSVPEFLEETAWIDGCDHFKALSKVVAPVVMPGIAAIFTLAFVNSQNELFMTVMFIDVDKSRTIPVELNGPILRYDIRWGEMAAGTVISLVPTTYLFVFVQEYMIEGLTTGPVKG